MFPGLVPNCILTSPKNTCPTSKIPRVMPTSRLLVGDTWMSFLINLNKRNTREEGWAAIVLTTLFHEACLFPGDSLNQSKGQRSPPPLPVYTKLPRVRTSGPMGDPTSHLSRNPTKVVLNQDLTQPATNLRKRYGCIGREREGKANS